MKEWDHLIHKLNLALVWLEGWLVGIYTARDESLSFITDRQVLDH